MQNGGDTQTTEGETSTSKARVNKNHVHVLRSKIESAFSPAYQRQRTQNEDCVTVIGRFLEITDWSQGSRRIFESMPHADTMETLAAFRSMLFRLGFKTTTEVATTTKLRKEYLPCFIQTANGRVILAEKCNDENMLVIFDPRNKRRIEIAAEKVTGIAIFPELDSKDSDTAASTQTKWSARVIQALRPVIFQILLVSFIVNLFALAPPLFVMNVYDKAIGTKSLSVLIGLTVGIGIIIAADYALRQLRTK